jgi:uncharacterized alpha-E superfamily protein
MLSRVADNLYWFGRYLQRAENTARLVNVNDTLVLDLPKKMHSGWQPLVDIIGAQEAFASLYEEPSEANVTRFLLTDERSTGSVLSSLRNAREILRVTRDTMPREAWEKLNDIYLFVQAISEKGVGRRYRQDFLGRVTDACLLVSGLLTTNMSRDVGFQFLRIGTNLEQADMTTRIIEVRSVSMIQTQGSEELAPFENIQWMSVLQSLTGYQMYRRHVRQRVSGPQVLRFLLRNREFPRSVMACLHQIEGTLPALPRHRPVERALERTLALTRDADIDSLAKRGLGDFMDEIQAGLGELHEAVHAAYFSVK